MKDLKSMTKKRFLFSLGTLFLQIPENSLKATFKGKVLRF